MPGLTYGLKATISIRLTNYGPCQHVEKLFPREVASLVYDARPKLHGDGRNVRDWIYAGSHCSAAWAILMRDRMDRAYLVSVDGECGDLPVMREPLRSRGCESRVIQSPSFLISTSGPQARLVLGRRMDNEPVDERREGGFPRSFLARGQLQVVPGLRGL